MDHEEDADRPVFASVSLVPAHDDVVTARLSTTDGSATAPADYQPLDVTVRFEPGETHKEFLTVIKGDNHTELNGEHFFFDLTDIVGAPAIGNTRTRVEIEDDERAGLFYCNATPVVAPVIGTPVSVGVFNPHFPVCADGAGEAPALSGSPPLSALRIFGATGRTVAEPDFTWLTDPSPSDGVSAHSFVSRLEVRMPGVAIDANGLEGQATANCAASLSSGIPAVAASSSIGTLSVNGQVIDTAALGGRPLSIPLGIGTLHINQSEMLTDSRSGRRVRALFLDLPETANDVIAGAALAAFQGTPCT